MPDHCTTNMITVQTNHISTCMNQYHYSTNQSDRSTHNLMTGVLFVHNNTIFTQALLLLMQYYNFDGTLCLPAYGVIHGTHSTSQQHPGASYYVITCVAAR